MHDPNQLNFHRAKEEEEIRGVAEFDDSRLEAKAYAYDNWKNTAELTSREQEALSRLTARVIFEAEQRGLTLDWIEDQSQLEAAEL